MVAETPDPLEQDYRTVFTTEAGERVLRDLMNHSFIWGTTFSSCAITMANNEGRRDNVLYILRKIGKRMEKPTTYANEEGIQEQDYPNA